MKISTLWYSIKEGFKNIGRNRMFSIASIITMSACIFLFGLFFSIVINFNYIVEEAEKGVAITVFFDEDCTDERKEEIGEELKKEEGVLEVNYISADEAWESFQDSYFGDSKEAAEGFKNDNPLATSDSYEVYMDDVDLQSDVVDFAESLEGVRKVNKSDVVANTLSSLNRLIMYVSIAIIIILLVVAVFLISNTVNTGITVRSEEIAIMKYIGAKNSFVRAPFIFEGIFIGFIGALIPLVLLYFLYGQAVSYIMTRFSLLNSIMEFLPVSSVYMILLPVGLILGVGIGFIGSLFAVRRHLKV